MATRRIQVDIIGDSKSLEKAFGRSSKHADSFGSKLGGIAKGAALAGGAAGVGLLTIGLEKSVKAGMEAEASEARLAVAFKNAHIAIKPLKGSIDKTEAASRKLGFTDDEVRSSLGSLITATHNYHKSVKLVGVAEDVARFKHVDLTQATKMLTMAQTGSQRAIKQLGLTIIPSTRHMDELKTAYKNQKAAIDEQEKSLKNETQAQKDHFDAIRSNITSIYDSDKAYAKMKDTQVNADKITQEVSKHLKGQAAAFSDTAAGGMAQFSAQLNHIEEQIGKKLLPVITQAIATVMRNWPQISATIQAAWVQIKPTLIAAGDLIKRIVDIVVQNWPQIRPVIMTVAKSIGDQMKIIAAALRLVTDLLSGRWGKAWEDVKALVMRVVGLVKDYLLSQVHFFETVMAAIGSAALRGLKAGFGGAAEWVKGRVDAVVGYFAGLPVGIAKAVESGAGAAKKMLGAAISKIFSVLPGFVRDALGIHSPSRVFSDIGHQIIMGAVHGIEHAGPKLLKAARDKFGALTGFLKGQTPPNFSVPGAPAGGAGNVALGRQMAAAMGWTGPNWDALYALWVQESGWSNYAYNASSGATGIPQALPYTKMPRAAWLPQQGGQASPGAQIAWGLSYIRGRYGSPLAAWAHEKAFNWYGKGGIFNKPTIAGIGESGPEAVIPLDSGIDISELGAQRIADAADRTTWARSPEVHVAELAQVLHGTPLPIVVMTLSENVVGQMKGAVQGAADAIGGAVASAIGPLFGGGGGGDGGAGGVIGGGHPIGAHGGGTTGGITIGGSGGGAGTTIGGHPGGLGATTNGIQEIHLKLDNKTVAKVAQVGANRWQQVNGGTWLPPT